jgi:hypothetical protein
LWGTLGTAHVGGARIAEATEAYTKQIAVAPSLWSYKRAAFTLIDFIRYEESLPFFEGGMRAFPDDRDLPAMYAETLLMLRQNDRAEAVVRTEVLKRPRSARLHMTLGRAQMRLGRTTEGIAALKRAVTIENGPNMLNAAARELLAANVELELAFDYAGQAVSRTASQMEGYTNLASLPSGATTASGRMAAYMETLGRLLERRGDRGRAKAYCDAAWRLAQRPLSAECLARVAEAEGDAATAARLSTVAQSRLVPSDPTAPWESPRGTVEEVARLNVEAFAVRRAVVTQTMPRPDGAIGSVRATLLVDGMGVVRQVTTPEGAAPAIRGALMNLTIGPVIPDRPDVRLRRIATVACTADAQTCTLTFDREIARTGV